MRTGTSAGTLTFNEWGDPILINTVELNDRIEMVYKEISNVTYTMHPTPPQAERVFKIVFSCKDGKWNKSERIYGEVVPSREESYKF